MEVANGLSITVALPASSANNPVEIAKTFWRMFQAAERGEKVESAYTELFIRTGQTVPNLNSKTE